MFLKHLQDFITKRHEEMPEGSYTTSLFESGVNKMAQKVGEEAVETVIEACNGTDERLIYEGADLIYHLIVLLTSKDIVWKIWHENCRNVIALRGRNTN